MDLPAFAAKAFEYCRLTGGSVVYWIASRGHHDSEQECQQAAHLDGLAVDVIYFKRPTNDELDHIVALVGLVRLPSPGYDHIEAPPPIRED